MLAREDRHGEKIKGLMAVGKGSGEGNYLLDAKNTDILICESQDLTIQTLSRPKKI
jgi:hypothetical protein